jgi:hypothetical protein
MNYADEIVKRLDIEQYIVGILPKPALVIDDLPMLSWTGQFNITQGWTAIETLSNKLEGHFGEDNATLREINEF